MLLNAVWYNLKTLSFITYNFSYLNLIVNQQSLTFEYKPFNIFKGYEGMIPLIIPTYQHSFIYYLTTFEYNLKKKKIKREERTHTTYSMWIFFNFIHFYWNLYSKDLFVRYDNKQTTSTYTCPSEPIIALIYN